MKSDLKIILESGESGYWIASVPEFLGAFSQGRTKSQARANVIDAMHELMIARRELAIDNPRLGHNSAISGGIESNKK